MTRKLTADELALWEAFTRNIRPLARDQVANNPPNVFVCVSRDSFSYTLDLHGLSLHDAHARFTSFIWDAYDRGARYVTVITGRSGQIRVEFPEWAAKDRLIRYIEPLPNGGSFRVYVKK